ncbi:MAG: phage GP46 family protein [Arenicella sp.]
MTQCDTHKNDGWDWIVTPQQEQFIELTNIADWQIKDGDLVNDNQLHSAVIIQLFTDKRIADDNVIDLPLGTDDKRGWWGDFFSEFPIGSLLWTLYRQYLTDEIIEDAERHVRDALKPLIDQGAAARADVLIEVNKQSGYMGIHPILYARNGEEIYKQEYRRFWDQ